MGGGLSFQSRGTGAFGRPRMRAVWGGGVYDGGGRQSYPMSLIVLTQLPVCPSLQESTGRKSRPLYATGTMEEVCPVEICPCVKVWKNTDMFVELEARSSCDLH